MPTPGAHIPTVGEAVHLLMGAGYGGELRTLSLPLCVCVHCCTHHPLCTQCGGWWSL